MVLQPQNLLSNLLTAWDELPLLCGPDWPELLRRLEPIAARLQQDGASPDWLSDELQRLFARCPRAWDRLQSGPDPSAAPTRVGVRTRGGVITRSGGVRTRSGAALPTTMTGLARQFRRRVQPGLVTRHADVSCPERAHVQAQRISLVVRLLTKAPDVGPTAELELAENELVRVHLDAPGFELLSPQVQETEVRTGADSAPVVFDLKPRQIGHHLLTVSFFQQGNPAGVVPVRIECTDYEVAAVSKPSRPTELRAYAAGAAPDMVLLVSYQSEPPALRFTLMQEGGAWWRSFAPVAITGNPASYSAGLYRDLTGLVGRSDPVNTAHGQAAGRQLSPSEVDRSVYKLGMNLWKQLIPDELKKLYTENRESWKNRSMLLLSDEPTLPWELVWPYDTYQTAWKDEHPWCCTFRLTRWLRRDEHDKGNESPPPRLKMTSLAIIAPPDSNLPSAQQEREKLLALAAQHKIANLSPPASTLKAVTELLEDGHFDWLHVAAHGNFHADSPDGHSALWLQDRMPLTPDSIVGPEIEGALRRKRPGFLFNACEIGRQGLGLTGLAGWASRLVGSGAGLFAGPLWEITDEGASNFALELYRRLLDGATVGEALQQTRLAIHQKGDPTWLAYSVYSHPNAHLLVTDEPKETPP